MKGGGESVLIKRSRTIILHFTSHKTEKKKKKHAANKMLKGSPLSALTCH